MTDILTRLSEAAQKATPGPWGLTIDCPNDESIPHRIALSPEAKPEDEIALLPSRPPRAHDAAYLALAEPQTILALVEVARAAKVVDARGGAWGDHTPGCARSIAHEHGHQEGIFGTTRHWVYDVTVPCDCGTGALKTALATLTNKSVRTSAHCRRPPRG